MNLQIVNRNTPKKQLKVYPETVKKVQLSFSFFNLQFKKYSSGWCTTGEVHPTKY